MEDIAELMTRMMVHDSQDPHSINHFLKVYSYALAIGTKEKLDDHTLRTLLLTSLVHDIGIKKAREKYGSSVGHYQEIEGPAIAREMLSSMNIEEDVIDRICYLVGHHHTYHDIDGMDYQILVEADFLVNIDESEKYYKSKDVSLERIFKTKTGIEIYHHLFG